MLISKFNRMIHNKVVWGVFALLVSLSMFSLGAASWRGTRNRNKSREAGKLFGKPVTLDELQAARMGVLGFRKQPDLTQKQLHEVQRQSWRRIALLRKAEEMGIGVSDSELAQLIQKDETFQNNGVFNKQQYEYIVRRQLGIPMSTFEGVVRQDVIIQKLQAATSATLWIPPQEVNTTLARLSDNFTVALAELDFDKLAGSPEVTDDEVKAYYEENTERFRVPEKRSIQYAHWSISNYMDEAIAEVEPDAIESYYDENMDDYATTETNGLTSYQPLEEVTNDICQTLAVRIAKYKALEAATDASLDINGASSFGPVLSQMGLQTATTELFSAYGSIEGLEDADYKFNTTVFDLSPDEEGLNSVSDPIPTEQSVYLVRLVQVVESYIPPFEDVATEAHELASSQAQADAFDKAAAELREMLVTKVRNNETFADAAAELGCSVTNIPTFLPFQTGGSEGDPMVASVAREVIDLQPGELTKVVNTFAGAGIAYLVSRTPSDIQMVEMLRPEVEQSITRYRSQINFDMWADSVLAEAGGMPDAELFEDDEEESTEI